MALQKLDTIKQYKAEVHKLLMILSKTEGRMSNVGGLIREIGRAIATEDSSRMKIALEKLRKEADYYEQRDSWNQANGKVRTARLQEHIHQNGISQGNGRIVY